MDIALSYLIYFRKGPRHRTRYVNSRLKVVQKRLLNTCYSAILEAGEQTCLVVESKVDDTGPASAFVLNEQLQIMLATTLYSRTCSRKDQRNVESYVYARLKAVLKRLHDT